MNTISASGRTAMVFLLFSLALQAQGQPILDKQEMLDRFKFWNNQDWEWYKENIPFLETPDKDIDMTYYYRWEIMTIHLVYGSPLSGYASTEFIDRPRWSGSYGTIACPAGHHIYDFRWFRDENFVKDYSHYWFRTPGAQPYNYTNWIGDAIWQSYKVNRDFKFVANLLNDLKCNYYEWERRHWVESEGMFAWDGMHDGMETNINSRQTPRWFAGAPGYRPTFNSYMWAHASAVANIANLAGDDETLKEFSRKANTIKTNFLEKCWDPSRNFFFHRFQNDEVTADGTDTIRANTLTYQSGQYEGDPHGREEIGFVPWYFSMPDAGYESAWQYLMDQDYFFADFGPTVTEQQDPLFRIAERCCVWSGNSWPFATSQTLKAMANLLNDYQQDYITRDDYFKLLRIFTMTHRKDGKPYIAEAAHPHTGSWSGHDRPGHSEHYSHSSYIDLIITGLLGLDPQESDSIVVNPLIPEDWDYFCLDDVMYHGHRVSIVWDRDGSRYDKGAGLQIFSDGVSIAHSVTLTRLETHIPYRQIEEPLRLVNYAVNNSNDYHPRAMASFPGIEHPYTKLNDGQFWNLKPYTNQWSNLHSNAGMDWCGIDFGDERCIQMVKLYFIDDDSIIKKPVSYELEYWDGEAWLQIPGQQRNSSKPEGRRANTISFPEFKTSKIRCVLTPQEGYNIGVSEFETWGKPVFPVSRPSQIATDNVAFKTMASATASYTSRFDRVQTINDGSIDPSGRWTAYESPNKSDWVQINFNKTRSVHTAYLYLYSGGRGVRLPRSFTLQYWDGNSWADVSGQVNLPETPFANALNICRFDEVETSRIRVVFVHASDEHFSGIYELELYGNNSSLD